MTKHHLRIVRKGVAGTTVEILSTTLNLLKDKWHRHLKGNRGVLISMTLSLIRWVEVFIIVLYRRETNKI